MNRILTTNPARILLFSIAVILGSCKAQKMTSDQLMPQDYTITQIGEKDVSGSEMTIKVNPENSTISGYSGCNNYSFNYKLKGEVLDLGFASATKIYCAGEMDNENLFFQKAASVVQFENSKKEINFKNKDGVTVIKAKKLEKSE
jgi:heat shock protein HslJ